MSNFETTVNLQLKKLRDELKCVKDKQCEVVPENFDAGPELIFHWGDPSTILEKANATSYVETKNVDVAGGTNHPMDIYKLRLNVANWGDISNYNPVLLIDRYKPRNYKGLSNEVGNVGQREYRKAGYRHETQTVAALAGRTSEVSLLGAETLLDIGQENYFRFVGTAPDVYLRARGYGKKQANSKLHTTLNNPGATKFGPAAYVYLGFRLRLTFDQGEEIERTIETGHLAFLKMQVRYKSPDNWELTYKIE